MELGGNNWLQQLQLQRDCPRAASGLGLQPLLGQVPSKRGMVMLLQCCCLARARRSPQHRGVPSCFSSLCFGEQRPLTVQDQLCSGAAQQWMSILNISGNNGVLLIPVWHHHLSSKAQTLFSGNHP